MTNFEHDQTESIESIPEMNHGCELQVDGSHGFFHWKMTSWGGYSGVPWSQSKYHLVGGDWNMTFIFPYLGNVIIPIHWYFSEGLNPPTSHGHIDLEDFDRMSSHCGVHQLGFGTLHGQQGRFWCRKWGRFAVRNEGLAPEGGALIHFTPKNGYK